MKTKLKLVSILPLLVSTLAFAADVEVISKETVSMAGVDISLPKVRKENGDICQSYISQANQTVSPNNEGSSITVKIEAVCGKPKVLRSNGKVGEDLWYPEQLESINFIKSGDMGIHVLHIKYD